MVLDGEYQSPSYEQLSKFGYEHNWHWSRRRKSKDARIYGSDKKTVCFHPYWSNGTAGIMGTAAINNGSSKCYFWEIQVSDRIFGTSTMFGIGTRRTCLHINTFMNLLGRDKHSWGLCHTGILYHNGTRRRYCRPFRENEPTRIGVLYDHRLGNLSFFKDGNYLGVAFTGLNKVNDKLYPIISSTAAKTEIVLKNGRRDFKNLQERCKQIIKRHTNNVEQLPVKLPPRLLNYIHNDYDDDNMDDEDDEHGDDKDDGNAYCTTVMSNDGETHKNRSDNEKSEISSTLRSECISKIEITYPLATQHSSYKSLKTCH